MMKFGWGNVIMKYILNVPLITKHRSLIVTASVVVISIMTGLLLNFNASGEALPGERKVSGAPSKKADAVTKKAKPPVTKPTDPTTNPRPLVSQQAPVPASVTAIATSPAWEQNFAAMQNITVDPSVWYNELNPDVPGYNGEKQAYTSRATNIRIEPTKGLVIEARKENYTYPNDTQGRIFGYTSARIDTRNSFSFEYGKVEAIMKLPKGAGTWPAFWMLSANQFYTSKLNPTDADWQTPRFYLKDGELDAMEHYGSMPGVIEGTAHSVLGVSEGNTQIADYDTAYHTYGVEVTPGQITWSVDGKAYHVLKKTSNDPDAWPFGNGNKLYVIFNLAMGGSGGGAIDDSQGPWKFEIQKVRYFDYIGPR